LRREKKKLSPSDLKAGGVSRELVVRRARSGGTPLLLSGAIQEGD
jgi:hypothetical protein